MYKKCRFWGRHCLLIVFPSDKQIFHLRAAASGTKTINAPQRIDIFILARPNCLHYFANVAGKFPLLVCFPHISKSLQMPFGAFHIARLLTYGHFLHITFPSKSVCVHIFRIKKVAETFQKLNHYQTFPSKLCYDQPYHFQPRSNWCNSPFKNKFVQ